MFESDNTSILLCAVQIVQTSFSRLAERQKVNRHKWVRTQYVLSILLISVTANIQRPKLECHSMVHQLILVYYLSRLWLIDVLREFCDAIQELSVKEMTGMRSKTQSCSSLLKIVIPLEQVCFQELNIHW